MSGLIKKYPKISLAMVISGVLLLAASIYLPGLGGRFLLDDYYNLHDLDQVRQYGHGAYVFGSGFAGPSGRPLSLLTFSLQHGSWPDNPAEFKLFNLFVHLLNTLLVFCLCRLLAGTLLANAGQKAFLCVVVTALWSLHPIQISTTLYVVQRMTQLSALFSLLGMIGYLHVRLRLLRDDQWRGYLYLGCIVLFSTLLAALAKENGILLPLYLLVIEGTLLSAQPPDRRLAVCKAVFLGLPLLILAGYLLLNSVDVYRSYHAQDYSMYQKTITEGIVLLEYVKNIVIPRASAFGLYHDDFPVSAGLLDPPSTLFALVSVAGVLTLALVKRKSLPVLAFACLWFLGGHVLESGYLNLELYFEHRNYLPLFGLVFGMAMLAIRAVNAVSGKSMVYAAAVAYCLLVILVARIEIDIWSKPGLQAMEWARRHPRSERAQQDLLQFYLINNDFRNAQATVTRLEQLSPDYFYPALSRIYIDACRLQQPMADAVWAKYLDLAGRAVSDGLTTVVALDQLVVNVVSGACAGLPPDRLRVLIQRLSENREYAGNAFLPEYLAALDIYTGRQQHALEQMRRSLQLEFTVPRKLREVMLLNRMGDHTAARAARAELHAYLQNNYRMRWAYGRMLETMKLE
jgi:hypothetical protein